MTHVDRRLWLKAAAGTLAAAPLALVAARAGAAQNAGSRQALKYQDQPKGSSQCSNCQHFVPGKSDKEPGACKIIPGDTEISPRGWCVAWTKKA